MPGMADTLSTLWVRPGPHSFSLGLQPALSVPQEGTSSNMRCVCWEPDGSLQLRDKEGLDHSKRGSERGPF